MGRARYTSRELHCHNCDRRWWGTVYVLDAHMRELHSLDPHNPCSRCSLVHGEGTICKYLPETCTCDTPHVEVISNPGRGSRYAQVRAEQRCVVYKMPDGSIVVPETNSYTDEGALDAVSEGGIREEMYHLSDIQRLYNERRIADHMYDELGLVDEYGRKTVEDYGDRSLVLDYNQASIVNRETHLHERMRQKQESIRQSSERVRGGEIIFDGSFYDEFKEKCEQMRRER